MKYSFDSRIRFSETDENGLLTLAGLIDYFQDVCTFQAEDLGIGFDYLIPSHRAWILASWQIMITRMPGLGETVAAATWPYEFKSFFGLRNCTLTDAQGRTCACANSVWILFDLEKNIPVRVGNDLLERYALSPRLDMDYASRKVALPKEHTVLDTFRIGRHHLDRNHHVNNAQYVQMAQAYLPEGFSFHQVRAEYLSQARLGDPVTVVEAETLRTASEAETALKDPFLSSITIGLQGPDGKSYAVVEFS